jgi:Arc/MetJ-type ribon-helix-helix transcriptional regulator
MRITVSLPIEIAKRIRVAAGKSHSVSEWVAGAVERTLEEEDVKRRFVNWCEQTKASEEDERRVAHALDRIRKGKAPVRPGRKRAA